METGEILLAVGAAFGLPVLAFLGALWLRKLQQEARRPSYLRERPSWSRNPTEIKLFSGREDNFFPFDRLSERIMPTLQFKATPEFHHNLYQRASSDRAVNEKRGKKFELMIYEFLLEKQVENPYLQIIEREKWLSSDSRVDFFLVWKLPGGDKFVALLECKHSIKLESRLCQIENGLAQLKRYRRRCPEANFLILVVDFRFPFFDLPYTVSTDNEILLINYGALHILFDEIADFVKAEVRDRKLGQLHRPTPPTSFKELQGSEREEEILDLDVLVAMPEKKAAPNKRERKSAPYRALLEFFQEKLGEDTRVEFEIEVEALRDKMGVSGEKYRVEGNFWPSLFKVNCLLPNVKKLERHLKIKAEVLEKKENSRKTLIFKVERLEGCGEEKPTEKPPSEDWTPTTEEDDDFLRLIEESTIQEKIWREEKRKEEERIKKIIEENFSHEAIMRRLKGGAPSISRLKD